MFSTPETSIKTVNQSIRERGRLWGKGSGEKVSFMMRMEDPVRHANHRFRSRVRAWQWRRVLWGGWLTRNVKRWRKFVP